MTEGSDYPYRVLIENMNEGAVTVSSDSTIVFCNRKFSKLVQAPPEKVTGSSIRAFILPDELHAFDTMLKRSFREGAQAEFTLVSATGARIPVCLSGHGLPVPDAGSISIVVTDLTAGKRAEESSRRANRALKVIVQLHQVMASASDEVGLLNDLCRILVDTGGYRMAWIGYALNDDAKTIRPMAYGGVEDGYLKTVNWSWALHSQAGQGPIAKTIRTGRIQIVKDIHQDPSLVAFREAAASRGYISLITLPLLIEGETAGGLAIWAGDADAYDEEEVALLKQLATDLGFGISTLRLRVEHARAHEALAQSERRFRAMFEESSDCMVLMDAELKFTHLNPACQRLLEMKDRDFAGLTHHEFLDPETAAYFTELDRRALAGETIEVEHTLSIGGLPLTFSSVRFPITDDSHNVVGVFCIMRNITERKRLAASPPQRTEDVASPAMRHTLSMARMAAQSTSTVLLLGESGSGKDYLARYIHEQSKRANGPYFSVNCAAISPELAESELFGYERGAFTGAQSRKRGLLELAEGGTLLLNEIGELSLALQAKLLTFLDTKQFTRVGGEKHITVDARLIAATNRDLEEEVAAGTFRQDLFYRLNVLSIVVPPLRQRVEDIPTIAREILDALAAELQMPRVPTLDTGVTKRLTRYLWPGNVRELRNVVERALILWDGQHFDVMLPGTDTLRETCAGEAEVRAGRTLKEVTDEVTRSMCVEALRVSGGNKKDAAKLLGIARDSLYRYMKQLGIVSDGST